MSFKNVRYGSQKTVSNHLDRLQIFTIAPIVRIELEAIVIVAIVRVVLVMSVVFPYAEQVTQMIMSSI